MDEATKPSQDYLANPDQADPEDDYEEEDLHLYLSDSDELEEHPSLGKICKLSYGKMSNMLYGCG